MLWPLGAGSATSRQRAGCSAAQRDSAASTCAGMASQVGSSRLTSLMRMQQCARAVTALVVGRGGEQHAVLGWVADQGALGRGFGYQAGCLDAGEHAVEGWLVREVYGEVAEAGGV